MTTFFILWTLHILLGIIWLSYFISKDKNQPTNMIGSLFLIVCWPIHMIYQILKKCGSYLIGLRTRSKEKK